jgi:hypothetical protein
MSDEDSEANGNEGGAESQKLQAPPRRVHAIRSLQDATGVYLCNVNVFVRRARELLTELETLVDEINKKWPIPLNETIREPAKYPELEKLTFKRDWVADGVLISSAMAVEAFLNYYGVVRLGETEYRRFLERLPLVQKLRAMLLFCDSISLQEDDPLISAIQQISQKRNALVHPKTQEVGGYIPGECRPGLLLPQAAQDAIANMETFFHEFLAAVPEAHHLVPCPLNSAVKTDCPTRFSL